VLALAIATALGPSVVNAALAVIVVWWPGYARLARAETRLTRTLEYVQAARNLGAGVPRIVLRHILPNIASSLVVKASLDAGTLLLVLSGLSFLGVGAQPPNPEWGLEVATAGQYMFDSPWYLIAPSAAIFITVFSLNLVGDALRERLDPRLTDA
jgi:peptide/nickel transport system permease protein